MNPVSMNPVDTLVSLLDLESLTPDRFRGHSPRLITARVFGGQVIAQALVAAQRTVEGRAVHSMHGYFMLPGKPEIPIDYVVERIREGRSFATRRVSAMQNGAAIFTMAASFQIEEGGLHHAMTMPQVPDPETLPDTQAMVEKYLTDPAHPRHRFWTRPRAIEIRPCYPEGYFHRTPQAPAQHVWFRATSALPEGRNLHSAVLAYATDMTLLDSSLVAHGKSVVDEDIQPASLDHALWFHEPFRADDWLLYAQDSPWTGHARGIARGLIYTREGRLVASAVQEGLVRQLQR
jgi:acyl-CoA thioesterase II